MVAAPTASIFSRRASIALAIGELLAFPGAGVALLVALPTVAVLAVLGESNAVGHHDELKWAAWLAATLLGYAAIFAAVRAPAGRVERRVRLWLLIAYACSTSWFLLSGATMHAGRNRPELADLLLVGVMASALPSLIAFLRHAIHGVSRTAFFLDVGCVALADFTMVGAIMEPRPGAQGAGLLVAFYPGAFYLAAAIAALAVVAARLPVALRGGYLIVAGTTLLGIATSEWIAGWLAQTPAVLPSAAFAPAIVLNAAGVATSCTSLEARAGRAHSAAIVHDALPLVAVAMAMLVLLVTDVSFAEAPVVAVLCAVVAGFVVAREVLLLRSRRGLVVTAQEAQAATRAALDRAEAAESQQRARADRLAEILRASEALALGGETEPSYGAVLAAITPVGASSFLARLDEQRQEFVPLAVHGPLAETIATFHRPWADGSPSREFRYHSRSGRAIPGGIEGPHGTGRIAGQTNVAAGLGIPLFDRAGRLQGSLHLLDPDEERVLEPDVIAFAQLVANQISVALENQALVAAVQDQLAEVQRVQEQLIHASKLSAIGELAAAVAHEVNNPLTGILGFSELLLAEVPADDPRHEEIALIRREAIRARSIMRALLDFARPRPAYKVPSDLNALASEALDFVRYHASDAGVRIVETYVDLPPVELDPDGIKQVVVNLCNNALRSMPTGGELTVSTAIEHDRVVLAVRDQGVGMDAETIEKVFSPFHASRVAGNGGGVGLPVSLQIVQSHGGTIDVLSEPGRGSTFSVWLPLAPTSPPQPLERSVA